MFWISRCFFCHPWRDCPAETVQARTTVQGKKVQRSERHSHTVTVASFKKTQPTKLPSGSALPSCGHEWPASQTETNWEKIDSQKQFQNKRSEAFERIWSTCTTNYGKPVYISTIFLWDCWKTHKNQTSSILLCSSLSKNPKNSPLLQKKIPVDDAIRCSPRKGPGSAVPKCLTPIDMQVWVCVFCFFGMKHANIANIIVPACEIFDNDFIYVSYCLMTIGSGFTFLCVTVLNVVWHFNVPVKLHHTWATAPTHNHHAANPAVGNGPSLVVGVGPDSLGTSICMTRFPVKNLYGLGCPPSQKQSPPGLLYFQ